MHTTPLDIRIWRFVTRLGRSQHWNWRGWFNDTGVAMVVTAQVDWQTINIRRRFGSAIVPKPGHKLSAARVLWGLVRGNVPMDKLVIRTCSASTCVNPYHHRLGLRQEVQDESTGRNTKKRGAALPHAVLTEEDVRQILSQHFVDGIAQYRLAEQYCVSKTTIFNIVHGESWNHVSGLPKLNYHNNYDKRERRVIKPPKVRFRD